jgi:hypothetical protein
MGLPTDPKELANLLLVQALAETYPDYPKNFIPPKYVDPNYVAPNIGYRITIVCYISMPVALIVVVARLICRYARAGDTFGPDDWLVIPATVRIPEGDGSLHRSGNLLTRRALDLACSDGIHGN